MTSSDPKLPKRQSMVPGPRPSLLPGSRSSMLPGPRASLPPSARSTVPPEAAGSRLPGARSTILPSSTSPPGHLHEDSEQPGSPSFPAVERNLERMTSTFGELGRLVGSTIGLPGLDEGTGSGPVTTQPPGAPAGIDHLREHWTPPEPGSIRIRVIDVCPERVETRWIDDVEDLIAEVRPEWVTLRWIDVDGLNAYVVSRLQRTFGFHTLAAEDVLHVPQRPRVDAYGDHLFVIARMFSWKKSGLVTEQISMFVRGGLLVSFQELDDDVWNPVRDRLQHEQSKLRRADASYLAYSLLDATVDHTFPILERYGEMLDHLEDAALTKDPTSVLQEVHAIKRELTILRKAVWPMREVIAELSREDQIFVSADTRTYLRDVYQHCVQVIDIIETFRELASSLSDLSLSMASNRMNEVMKVLTIISTVFIPATFLAGVYGMNFHVLPELGWRYGYLTFWVAVAAVAAVQIWVFWRKGWFGRRS